jgi:hypothetical protein
MIYHRNVDDGLRRELEKVDRFWEYDDLEVKASTLEISTDD